MFVCSFWQLSMCRCRSVIYNFRMEKILLRDTSGGPPQHAQSGGRPPYSRAASTDGSPSATPRSRSAPLYAKSASRDTAVPSTDPPALPRFKVGQRVMFYGNNGDKHYGTVGWTASKTITRSFPYTVVGIKTVSVS